MVIKIDFNFMFIETEHILLSVELPAFISSPCKDEQRVNMADITALGGPKARQEFPDRGKVTRNIRPRSIPKFSFKDSFIKSFASGYFDYFTHILRADGSTPPTTRIPISRPCLSPSCVLHARPDDQYNSTTVTVMMV